MTEQEIEELLEEEYDRTDEECEFGYTYDAWIEAFGIFKKYGRSALCDLCAEHDEVYAGPDFEDISIEDAIRLLQLGWTNSDAGRFVRNV